MAKAGIKEAALVLRLIDGVSLPAKAVVGSLNSIKRAAGMLTAPGRGLNQLGRASRRNAADVAGLSAPMMMAGAAASRSVYNFEKAGNAMQAFGLLTAEQRKELEDYAQVLNVDFPFTNSKIIEAAQELFRAGLTFNQAMGALRGTLNLGLAGDIDVKQATDIATNVMTAMKLPMETFEQVNASMLKVNDTLAWAATNSNTDVALMGDTFRYVAPLAAAAGMELETVGAMAAELARAGIKGSEAGVALRSALVRMAKPTKPMLAAFERMNLKIGEFIEYKDKIAASSVTASLLPSGIDVANLNSEIQSILDDVKLAGAPNRMSAQITDVIVKSLGDETLRDEISSVINGAVLAGAQKVDLVGLLAAMRDKGATITDIAQVFDVRMGSRLAAIMYEDIHGAVEKLKSEYNGVGANMAGLMMQGVVGSTARLVAGVERMFIAIADSGVLDTVINAMDKFGTFLVKLSETNPQMLEFGTYAAMAAAAIAPLGIALSGMAGMMGLLISPLGLVVAGLGTLVALNWDATVKAFSDFGKGFTNALDPDTVEAFGRLADDVQKGLSKITFGLSETNFEGWGAGLADSIDWIIEALGKVGLAMAEIQAIDQKITNALSSAASQLSSQMYNLGRDMLDAFLRGLNEMMQSVLDWFSALPGKIMSAIGSIDLTSKIKMPSLFGSSAPDGPKPSGRTGRLIDGARAGGGPVQRGHIYEINEKGQEFFSPGSSGRIHPAGSQAGAMINHFHIRTSDPKGAAREVVSSLERLLERSRQTSLDDRPVYG